MNLYYSELIAEIRDTMATAAAASPAAGQKKTIVVSGDMSTGQQFVVTQSKGTTIIQPAATAGSQQYIVTGKLIIRANHGEMYADFVSIISLIDYSNIDHVIILCKSRIRTRKS